MSCEYNEVMELTYKYSFSSGKKCYLEDVIQLSRCCLLEPEWHIGYNDLICKQDIVEYIHELPLLSFPREALISGHPICNNSKCMLVDNNKIHTIIVGLSLACNLKCYNCWYDGCHYDSQKKKDLYFHVLYGLKGHNLNKIVLTNKGEPFFYLKETLNYLSSLSINDTKEIEAVTNGNCLNKESINLLKSISKEKGIKFSFVFSMDAVTEDTYRKTRIGGDFNKVLTNLSLCVDAFSPENILVSFTCKRTNKNEISLVRSFYEQNFGLNTQISFDSYEPELQQEIKDIYFIES